MSGACGPCTLCCTVMRVEMQPEKPARSRCPHDCHAGCAIYASRPQPCRDFQCAWLVSQGWDAGDRLSRELRPELSGVVIEINSKGYLVAHSHRPASWRKRPMLDFLIRMAARTRVMIEDGQGVQLLDRDGTTRQLHFFGIDKETNERMYRLELPA